MIAQERTYGKDDGANIVVKARSADSLLVRLRSASLLGEDETGANPNGGSAERNSSGERLTVEHTTSGNDLHGLTSQRALATLAQLGNGWDEDSSWDIASVAAAFAALSANDIGASIKGLRDVLGVANHVHVENASFVEFLDHGLGSNTDGADEQLGTALDDDVDEFVELALGVVIAANTNMLAMTLQGETQP